VPQATILLITGYMVSLGKTSMRYIEVTTLDWQDRDIVSPADVDAHIQKLQNDRKAADRVQGLLGIPQRFGDLNAEKVARWVLEWGFSDEMLRLAYQQTVEKCKKYTVSYMDKVLEGWHINGITTPEQLEKPRPAKKGAAVTNPEESSLDMEGFEEQLLQYRPKYKKK
ncbi:MAG: DnaD domain protein, partial [Clostridia bacterium]|nr:DnaD domain protein [Clostridia bacterium]